MKNWIIYLIALISSFSLTSGAAWENCIGNQTCNPRHYYEPQNLTELQSLLKEAVDEGQKVRIAGSGFSISDIVCTDGYLLNLKNFNQILSVDQANALVRVEAGITMKDLNEKLGEYDLALSNQAAVDNISFGGALATGAHGTGHTSTLSSFIKEIELMTAETG